MVQVVELSGRAYERGVACGRQLKPRIEAHMAAWRAWLTRSTGEPADAYVRAMVRDTDYVTAIRRHAPDLLEEVRGIATGRRRTRTSSTRSS